MSRNLGDRCRPRLGDGKQPFGVGGTSGLSSIAAARLRQGLGCPGAKKGAKMRALIQPGQSSRPIASCRAGGTKAIAAALRCRRGSSDATHGKADLGAQPGRPLQTSPR